MREEQNGNPFICMQNLIAIKKTECPFSRNKGIDAQLIDRPMNGTEEIDEEITDLVDNYEPRINVEDIELEMGEEDGESTITIVTREEGEDGD